MAIKPTDIIKPVEADERIADEFEKRIDRDILNFVRKSGNLDIVKLDYKGNEKQPDGLVEIELRKRYLEAGWKSFEVEHTYVRSGDNERSDWWENVITLKK
jgi:hypothetical protein